MGKVEELVTITLSEYNKLKDAEALLSALEAAGVDNWEWYGEAVSSLYEDEEEDY